MADPNFRIQGHKIEFFLGGDFKYLDGILGTQGSSAKMPCSKCKVGLDHLQGPEYCDCTLRSLEEMEGHYNANLCDTRGGKRGHLDLSSTGRYHESIKGRNLFKFSPLANVIPPILHITLEIVLRLFNKLLDQCRIVDETYNKPNLVRIDKEWHQRSLDLEEKEVLVQEIGGDYIDLVNFGERLEGDIDIIARQSDFSVKIKLPQECCKSVCCVISEYDCNVNWIQCDTCLCWFHVLCEGFASSEIVQVKSSSTYNCLRCSGAVADLDSVKKHNVARLELLREKQKIVEKEFKLLRDECLRLKSLIEEMVGPTERNLLKLLDDIKVLRQAYHGNVFVGNHCKIILRNFVMLCDVISRKAPEVCKDFKKVFGIFSEAHHYMAIKHLLSDSDIESLCYFCEELGHVYPMVFPESPCLTRKMHELIFHVPTFANKHKTVGFIVKRKVSLCIR